LKRKDVDARAHAGGHYFLDSLKQKRGPKKAIPEGAPTRQKIAAVGPKHLKKIQQAEGFIFLQEIRQIDVVDFICGKLACQRRLDPGIGVGEASLRDEGDALLFP
jgi:hypothetical protein